jgi:hypothetical protein
MAFVAEKEAHGRVSLCTSVSVSSLAGKPGPLLAIVVMDLILSQKNKKEIMTSEVYVSTQRAVFDKVSLF